MVTFLLFAFLAQEIITFEGDNALAESREQDERLLGQLFGLVDVLDFGLAIRLLCLQILSQ